MKLKYDIYDITTPKKNILVATRPSQSDALATIAALKTKSPDSRFVIKPEYDVPAVSS